MCGHSATLVVVHPPSYGYSRMFWMWMYDGSMAVHMSSYSVVLGFLNSTVVATWWFLCIWSFGAVKTLYCNLLGSMRKLDSTLLSLNKVIGKQGNSMGLAQNLPAFFFVPSFSFTIANLCILHVYWIFVWKVVLLGS